MGSQVAMFIKHFVSVEVKAATEIKTWCIESCLENKYDKINSGVEVLNLTVSKLPLNRK